MPMLDSTWKVCVLIGVLVVIRMALRFDGGLKPETKRSLIEFVDSALIALALVFFIIRPFVIQAFYIPSRSMEDTLKINDRILVNRFIYRYLGPRRGDIVVFKAPPKALETSSGSPEEKDFIKRLIGLPGDRIRVRDGYVEINGQRQDEPYIRERPLYTYPAPEDYMEATLPIDGDEVVVPQGAYFVLGDNRNQSHDGHRWGFVPRENVLGKALLVFFSWPPREPGSDGGGFDLKRLGWRRLSDRPRPIPFGAEEPLS